MTKYFNGNNPSLIEPITAASLLTSITSQSSGHPFLISNKQGNTGFHLAWDENTSSSSKIIRYCKLNAGASVSVVSGSYNSNVSSGSGFTNNSMPVMIASSDISVRMTWLGTGSFGRKSTVFRGMLSDGSWNPRFWSFGSGVTSQNINLGSDGYYILWNDYTSGSYKNQFTDSRTLSTIYTLNTTGKDVQINNDAGGSSSKMYAMSYSSQGAIPYSFIRSNSIGSYYGLSKSIPNDIAVASGRGIILSRDGSPEFHLHLEDILVDGKNVRFIAVSDTASLKSTNEINKYLTTEAFMLQDTSNFTFCTSLGVNDSVSALKKLLGENGTVSFRLELLDNNDKLISCLDNISLSGISSISPKLRSFKVSTNGIGSKQVKMRLSVENRAGLNLTMLDSYYSKEAASLNKSSLYEMIDINGYSARVTEYSLLQNYPNPFNPTTIISYQIPKASKVTLKIFDMLGKEVTTLVNGFQSEGKYSVEFNASSLPSGIYIYEIRANDFVKSGKMMLLK